MATKTKGKSSKTKSKKGRIKTIDLKRNAKDLSGAEKKKVKGGGGLSGGVFASN